MRHVTYTPGCAADGLTLTKSPVPDVGDGEVLIRVAYAGVGGTDLAQRAGKFNPKPDAPAHHLIMGLEISGVVVRCGAGVSDFKPGDRVASLLYGGGYSEYCVAPQQQVLAMVAQLNEVQRLRVESEESLRSVQGLVATLQAENELLLPDVFGSPGFSDRTRQQYRPFDHSSG